MPAITNIIKRYQPEQPILTLRTLIQEKELEKRFRECAQKAGKHMELYNATMTDVPFVIYHDYLFADPHHIDVEFCFPIDRSIPSSGEVEMRQIEAGNIIFTMYNGYYKGISEVYSYMTEWIIENGFKPRGNSYEYFFNDTGMNQSKVLVKVVIPYM